MPLVHFRNTCPVTQVEGFPAVVVEGETERTFQRSVDGALHVSPGATKMVTADELAVIRKNPLVGKHVSVLVHDDALLASDEQQAGDVVPPPVTPPAASDEGAPAPKPAAKPGRSGDQ